MASERAAMKSQGVACSQLCHSAGGDGSGMVVIMSLMDRLEGGNAFLYIYI